ncbi:hypothetical protein CONPUDRAFT_145673 [Coniophora puteana RWD-64-598 SS2]|uniref:DUF6699 domain-containing protein n=1 Tax=Coniophora puteana (strain RWD-64-598) TaxID=741705 RepID=A0A5M3MIH1_CONPW|nr:uncharacterized protein CONPUDRAFT_145673 [Coniophora puteana RWD-64-598 SS2]EIW78445.1 hypothetical protein CONPUDRAFT_145673 [Coniophora puteana RWD-64-598 SS2]
MSTTLKSCLKPTPPVHRPSSAASNSSSTSVASAASSWGTVETDAPTTPKHNHTQATEIKICPLISHNPLNPALPCLQWDTRQDFAATAKRMTPKGLILPLADAELDEPFTHPPAYAARIIIARLGSSSSRSVGALLGAGVAPLTVTKPKDGQAITARDVLGAVQAFLRVSVSAKQYKMACERIAQGQRTREGKCVGEESVTRAFRQRCSEIAPIRDVEQAKGVRRVDLLGDAVRWAGAWADCQRDEETKEWRWELRVAVAPKP